MPRDVTAPGRMLHQRFKSMGNMTGKSSAEIIAVVGRPTSISSMAHNQQLLQWQATGCHMALLFDANGQFVKFTHQYAKYAAASKGCMSVVVLLMFSGGLAGGGVFQVVRLIRG